MERKLHGWLLLLWATVGLLLTWLFKDAVPWLSFMSLYAIVVAHAAAWAATKPVEEDHDPD